MSYSLVVVFYSLLMESRCRICIAAQEVCQAHIWSKFNGFAVGCDRLGVLSLLIVPIASLVCLCE